MENRSSGTLPGKRPVTDPHQWVKNYADYLYDYAISRVNDEELARDLVQETFLAALEKLHNFEGRSAERTWLTAILKNKIVDIYRKKASGLINTGSNTRDQEPEEFFEPADGHWKDEHRPQEFARSPEDPLLSKEFNMVLRQCMEQLPALWLAVFTMKHLDDATTELICTELKVTAANFWVIIHRTKLNLRACLQKKWR